MSSKIINNKWWTKFLITIKHNKKAKVTILLFTVGILYQSYKYIKKCKTIQESIIIHQKQNIEKQPQNIIEQQNIQNNQLILPQDCQILTEIYNQTCNRRNVVQEFKLFVGPILNIQETIDEYGYKNINIIQVLQDNLSGMRRARGDGNCFYTSFVYQYLLFIINESNDILFNNFINNVKTSQFIIFLNDNEMQGEAQLQQNFIQYCQEIRKLPISIREKKFYDLISNPEGQFYGLSIIYLRNLTYQICNQDEETKNMFEILGYDLKKQILEWEYDCENCQSVIVILSKYLQIIINLYYIDDENKTIEIQQYGVKETKLTEINLLFRPGHYNIAIPKLK